MWAPLLKGDEIKFNYPGGETVWQSTQRKEEQTFLVHIITLSTCFTRIEIVSWALSHHQCHRFINADAKCCTVHSGNRNGLEVSHLLEETLILNQTERIKTLIYGFFFLGGGDVGWKTCVQTWRIWTKELKMPTNIWTTLHDGFYDLRFSSIKQAKNRDLFMIHDTIFTHINDKQVLVCFLCSSCVLDIFLPHKCIIWPPQRLAALCMCASWGYEYPFFKTLTDQKRKCTLKVNPIQQLRDKYSFCETWRFSLKII